MVAAHFRATQTIYKGPLVKKMAACLLLAAGVLLTALGAYFMSAASADVFRFFSGAPADSAILLLVVGIVVLVTSLAGLLPAFKDK